MGLAVPAALWGLTALVALVLLSFWRLRPARLPVPSVLLWKLLPDRVPPVRALRRPRASMSLLVQMLAVAAGVLALAKPYTEEQATKPRTVAIVVDLSARMLPRLDAAKDAYAQVRAALAPGDRVVTYTFPPVARHEGAFAWGVAHAAGDASIAIGLARREADIVVFIGDRPVDAPCEQVLVGGPMANTGVVDASLDGGRVYARILGPEGERVAEFAPAPEIRVADDAFALDDVLYLDRGKGTVDVLLAGRPHAEIRRALERHPRVRLVTGGRADVVVRVGEPARADDPPSRVVVHLEGEGFVPKTVATAHGLMNGVAASEVVLARAATISGDGEALLFADGRKVAVVRGREILIAAEIERAGWPAFPSFPIFWSNVIDFFSSDEWLVRRTFAPVGLADGRTVRAERVGENRFGADIVHANLLERRASDLAGESRPFDPSRLPSAVVESRRRDLSRWPAVLALLLVLTAWWLERKP